MTKSSSITISALQWTIYLSIIIIIIIIVMIIITIDT